jgi:hypothetical protein
MAADLYDKEVQLLLKYIRDVPPQQRYPDSLPPKEMRDRQVEVLHQAQAIEKSAIDALRKAL